MYALHVFSEILYKKLSVLNESKMRKIDLRQKNGAPFGREFRWKVTA